MDQKFEFFSDDYVFDDELSGSDEARELVVRLDKWLWAARFFKTRAVARAAVEKGCVFYNGERAKPSREIEVGATIYIQQGRFEKNVIVRGLSTRRRSTDDALQLFEETTDTDTENIGNRIQKQDNQPSERRGIRFLRRSFNPGGEPRAPRPKTNAPYFTFEPVE